jgi:hypothetical protein
VSNDCNERQLATLMTNVFQASAIAVRASMTYLVEMNMYFADLASIVIQGNVSNVYRPICLVMSMGLIVGRSPLAVKSYTFMY